MPRISITKLISPLSSFRCGYNRVFLRLPVSVKFRLCCAFMFATFLLHFWVPLGSQSKLKATPESLNRIPLNVLTTANRIQVNFGYVHLQLVNSAFVNIALSWICNVRTLNVLERTLFVATDVESFSALSLRAPHVELLVHETSALSYGQTVYFQYMLFRAKLVEKLLLHGISIWLIESDAAWFADPEPYLLKFTGMDVLVGQDGLLTDSIPEGGFIFLNSTVKTSKMWSALRKEHEEVLELKSELVHIGDAGSEMLMLPKHLKLVTWDFFDKQKFVSGKWYSSATMRSASKNPIVIQNNWIVGNHAKIYRAKNWSHWFLDEVTLSCVDANLLELQLLNAKSSNYVRFD